VSQEAAGNNRRVFAAPGRSLGRAGFGLKADLIAFSYAPESDSRTSSLRRHRRARAAKL